MLSGIGVFMSISVAGGNWLLFPLVVSDTDKSRSVMALSWLSVSTSMGTVAEVRVAGIVVLLGG